MAGRWRKQASRGGRLPAHSINSLSKLSNCDQTTPCILGIISYQSGALPFVAGLTTEGGDTVTCRVARSSHDHTHLHRSSCSEGWLSESGVLHLNSYRQWRKKRRNEMSTILIIVLVLLLVGVLPTWPHSANWGYYPSGGLGLILLVLVILAVTGRLG